MTAFHTCAMSKPVSGRGSFDFPNGTYDGEWREGKRHGHGVMRYAAGDCYEGCFVEGKKHGRGKCVYADSGMYDGEWSMGEWHGRGKVQWANGNTYEGGFAVGVVSGKGKFVWANGGSYEGEYSQGQKHGRGLILYAVGGEPSIPGLDYFWNAGDKMDCGFKHDVRHGTCTYTFFNGETFNCWWASGRCPEFTARQRAVRAAPDCVSSQARAAADQAATKAVADSMVSSSFCTLLHD